MVERAASDATASFQHHHIPPGRNQGPSRRQAREPRADHDDVRPSAPWALRKRRRRRAQAEHTSSHGRSFHDLPPRQTGVAGPITHVLVTHPCLSSSFPLAQN
jgi:hypothetical protein